jgi:glycosyltransferase involved in cell wall biosynthesis
MADTPLPQLVPRPIAGVAVCVYNGGRFLREQLQSIAQQTELPRRLVVVDDGSNDGSWEFLRGWAATAPFPVTLKRNASKLGVVRNFEKAVSLLLDEVDIVFFSDQDDRWFPDKLATMVNAFVSDPQVGLVYSDAELVDSDGRSLGSRLFSALLITERERSEIAAGRAHRAFIRRNVVTGAACACRSSVLAQAIPFSGRMIHDEWISFIASIVAGVRMLEQPLMAYRLHETNTVGLPIPTRRWWWRTVLRALLEPQVPRQRQRLERLEEMRGRAQLLGADNDVLVCLDRAIAHAKHRVNLPRNPLRRAPAVLAEWRSGQYHRWSSGRTSMLHDLLMAN